VTASRARTAALWAVAALALFAILVTLAVERGLWPQLAAGSLHDSDLWIGLGAGVAWLAILLVRRRPRSAD
jgi:hypothetical protein